MEPVNKRNIAGEGTPESIWRESFISRSIRQNLIIEFLANSKAVHIIAPHPDDEILACAGIIQQISQTDVPLQIVAITDGEASHPGSNRWPASSLIAARAEESELALRGLAPKATRKRLRLVDGDVTTHEYELINMLIALFGQDDMVIAPWRLDGHPDHEAAGHAAYLASDICGSRFFEVPIWGWHWACPEDGTFPWHRAVSIGLTSEEHRAKMHAIQLFRTQIEPDPDTGRQAVLPNFVVERFQRPFEVILQ